MKPRKIIVTKEIFTDHRIKEIKSYERLELGGLYEIKQVQVNVVKEGGKK